MKRELPRVYIAGTCFQVDVFHERLQEKDNPKNRIFFDVFEQERDGYTFLYDTKTRNVAEVAPESADERYQKITLPALMELDPEGIALKYNIPLEVLCPEKAGMPDPDDQEDGFYEDELFT